MKLRPNPETIKGQIFQSIQSYVFVALISWLSFAIRIYSLACLYNLKANKTKFSKYFEVYIWFSKMIVQNRHSLQSRCEVRKWKHVIWDFSIPLLGYQFSIGHVTSPDQGLSSKEGRAWERVCTRTWPCWNWHMPFDLARRRAIIRNVSISQHHYSLDTCFYNNWNYIQVTHWTGALGARAPPPPFFQRTKSALFCDECRCKCYINVEGALFVWKFWCSKKNLVENVHCTQFGMVWLENVSPPIFWCFLRPWIWRFIGKH
jgi:hypothetical protein